MDVIEKYFPELTSLQKERFAAMYGLYEEWNARINVISRKDMGHFYIRHVLHSLAIARVCRFDSGARIIDVGTGGGFPGIPLAVMFPEAEFTLADSIGKKITVVREVAKTLGLNNVTPVNRRAEGISEKYDYAVSRAVTAMDKFTGWVWDRLEPGQRGTLPNGILYLKGGDIAEEMAAAGKKYEIFDIGAFYDNGFFETKKTIYIRKI